MVSDLNLPEIDPKLTHLFICSFIPVFYLPSFLLSALTAPDPALHCQSAPTCLHAKRTRHGRVTWQLTLRKKTAESYRDDSIRCVCCANKTVMFNSESEAAEINGLVSQSPPLHLSKNKTHQNQVSIIWRPHCFTCC